MKPTTAAWVLGLALVAACSQSTDLGKPCVLHNVDGGIWTETSATDDLLYSGTTECEDLICLRPSGSTLDAGWGFCTNSPCTPDNGTPGTASEDCDSANTGLVCNTLTLDPQFEKSIEAEDGGAALLSEYLSSNYCTTQ